MTASRRAIVAATVSLFLVAGFLGAVNATLRPVAQTAIQDARVTASASGVAYEFYDFFNVPFSEYWDYREALYGDLPLNAECFTATGIANGICTPSNPGVADVASYPYTHWYPYVGESRPGFSRNVPYLYAPYRIRATGTDIGGYTLTDPVYLPIVKPTEPAGTRLDIDWRMDYLDTASATAMEAAGCPIGPLDIDGYHIRSQITVTLDLQESKRLFGVTATDAASARTWWSGNTNPSCLIRGAAESTWETAMVNLGGSQNAVGKYDIYNGYEWYYQPFVTQLLATVDNDGVTHVTIDHVAWGTEVLMSRFYYWGQASYATNYLDSTQAAGWMGMEYPWFEHFSFQTSVGATMHSFTLNTDMFYHFQQNAAPGPNGQFDRTDDIPYWTWGPWLADYVNDFSPKHLISEMDRYPNPPYTILYTTAGGFPYGTQRQYDSVPVNWNPKVGESFRFTFPTGNAVFYDPNLTPLGADPKRGQYVEIRKPLSLMSTLPASFGSWDPAGKVWTFAGPLSTGGPAGTAGADGIPGTPDDQYATDAMPAINLAPSSEPALLRVTTNIDAHPTWGVPGKILVDGIPRDEWGLAWMKIAPGPHTVSYTDIANLRTPASVSITAVSGAESTAVGTYKAKGWLRVMTDPPVPGTIYVNGNAMDDWGIWLATDPGTYTVSFGAVKDYLPPASQTVVVSAELLTTVVGRYTSSPGAPDPDPASYGLLRVTTRLSDGTPGVMSQIEVDGIPRDEWGLAWVKMPVGAHTLTFSDVWNYGTPAPQPFTITAGATTTLEGAFPVHGWLRVMTDPAVPGTIFVDGVPRNDWGMWQSMPPGSYAVSFGPVPGFTTPPPQTVTVSAGVLTVATGTYTAATASASEIEAAGDAVAPSASVSAVPSSLVVASVSRFEPQ